MPYKDQKKRNAASRRWRQSSTPEYHKWLYARRQLRFQKAEKYEQILRLIAAEEPPVDAQRLAEQWLDWFDEEEGRVGRYFDHLNNRPSNERSHAQRDTRDLDV